MPDRPITDHAALREDERQHILQQVRDAGLDVAACEAMPFRDLRDMWSDYLSDEAMMEGRVL